MRLGETTMVVEPGRDPLLDRAVLISRLPAEVAGAASSLGRPWAALSHPNIAALYDLVEQDEEAWLVSEYVDGVCLDDIEQRRLTGKGFQQTLGQLISALSYAHSHGIVHGAVGPEAMVLCDGLLKLLPLTPGRLGLGAEAGKIRSDVFGLGLVILHLAFGESAFQGPLTVPRGYPANLKEVFVRCCASSPRRRFPSVRAVWKALYPDTKLAGPEPGRLRRERRLGEQILVSDPEGSVASWKRALKLSPLDPALNNNLGVALSRAGQMTEAERAFRAAASGHPHHPRVVWNLGWLRLLEGDYLEAAQLGSRAAVLAPNWSWPRLLLALTYQGQAAIDEYREVLRMDPSNSFAHAALADQLTESAFADHHRQEARRLGGGGTLWPGLVMPEREELWPPGRRGWRLPKKPTPWPGPQDGPDIGVGARLRPGPRSPAARDAKAFPQG